MQIASTLRVELRHYFEIKKELAAAVRDADSQEIEYLIDELQIMAMHTDSARLRCVCLAAVTEQGPLLSGVVSA